MKLVNRETITGSQSWLKILPLKEFNLIRAKQKLLMRRKRVYESCSSRRRSRKVINTDNSLEFGKACEELSRNHSTSTLHRSETIGIAERAERRIEEGTSAVLLQSGLDETWWVICNMLKTSYQAGKQTPYERQFGEPPSGPIIPCG